VETRASERGEDPTGRLGRCRYVSLASFRRDGRAVETPVWIAGHAGRLYVFSEARAGKVKRLRNDPRVRLTPCNAWGALQGDPRPGRARIVNDAAIEALAYRALGDKYGWQMRLANLASRLAGRIDARAVLEITLDPAAEP
jgi:PPOX class probable F420-dependent enzyme